MTTSVTVTITTREGLLTLGELRELVNVGLFLPDRHPVTVSQTSNETRVSLSHSGSDSARGAY